MKEIYISASGVIQGHHGRLMSLLVGIQGIADNKYNVAQMMISVFDRVETSWEKKKMLVTSIFFFSHNVFKRCFSGSLIKTFGGEPLTHYQMTKF